MKTDLPPDEEKLAKMLATAFDRLPEPDVTRITALEQRLDRQLRTSQNRRKHPALYWWMLGGLLATGAAAWWAGDYYWGQQETIVESRESGSSNSSEGVPTENRDTPTETDKKLQNQHEETKGGKSKHPSMIYRRESY